MNFYLHDTYTIIVLYWSFFLSYLVFVDKKRLSLLIEYIVNQKYSLIYADILVGVIDHDGPQLYNIDMFGTLTKEEYYSTGRGSPVAYGILESEFKNDLTVEEAMPIAVKSVYGAILRNSGTGDGLNIVTIKKDNLKEYSLEEKQEILKELSGRL